MTHLHGMWTLSWWSLSLLPSPPPLPQTTKVQRCTIVIAGSGLKPDVVRAITAELRKRLGLTLFGYDTVVQQGTGEMEQPPTLLLPTHIISAIYVSCLPDSLPFSFLSNYDCDDNACRDSLHNRCELLPIV